MEWMAWMEVTIAALESTGVSASPSVSYYCKRLLGKDRSLHRHEPLDMAFPPVNSKLTEQ